MFGFAAVNTGNNLLYLLVSVFLGFLAMTGICGHRNLTGLGFKVLPSQELYAKTPGRIRIKVENRHRYLPRFLLKLTLGDTTRLIPVIAASGSQIVSLPLTVARRGWQPLPSLAVASRFPVNFFIRSCTVELQQQLLVFPQPLPAQLPLTGASHRQAALLQASLSGGDGDLRNVDDYRPGDPLKAIHWKLSARHQELKIKQLHQQAVPAIVLDPEQLPGSLEERLGRCAFLINELSARGRAVGLRLKDRQISPGSGRQHQLRLLAELALYE